MDDWRARLRATFAAAGHVMDEAVIEELAFHLSETYDLRRREGATDEQAMAEAEELLADFAADAKWLDRVPKREPAVVPPPAHVDWFSGVIGDLRYALRRAWRQRVAAILPILTIALGICACVTLFSLVNGVLLRPLPWPNADRLVRVWETRDGREGRVRGTIMNGTYRSWAETPQTIEALAGWLTPDRRTFVHGTHEPLRVTTAPITPNLLFTLGVRPYAGRAFVAGDGQRGATSVALISHALWQNSFGGSDAAIGSSIRVDDVPRTIVGVMEPGFAFPDASVEVWVPFDVPPAVTAQGTQSGVIFSAMAKLRPGVTLQQAADEATRLARAGSDIPTVALALFGAKGPIDIHLRGLHESFVADVRPALTILLAAVGLLLLAAAANTITLQLTRTTQRRRELAVRSALGASASRLWRQLAYENLAIGLAGGLAGTLAAATVVRKLPLWLPEDFPRRDDVAIDGITILVGLLLAVIVSGLCVAVPAWHLRRQNLARTLAEDANAPAGVSLRLEVARSRALMVTCQVAVSCVLLSGAILLGRSFVSLLRIDRGYEPLNVLTARLPLPTANTSGDQRREIAERVLARIKAWPRTTAAICTSLPLFGVGGGAVTFTLPSTIDGSPTEIQAIQRVASPGYLRALGIRLIEGRALSEFDSLGSPPVALVNESFARNFLGPHPIGARLPQKGRRAGLRVGNDEARQDLEVVGVVNDLVQEGPVVSTQPEIFVAFDQITTGNLGQFTPMFVVKTPDSPELHLADLQNIVREEAPGMALDSVITMEERLAATLARPRLYAAALILFAIVTLALTGIGIFGTVSQLVVMRTREIGIRTAIGAPTHHIVLLIVKQAIGIVVIGIASGLLIAKLGADYLSTLLFGITGIDVLTLASVMLSIACVAAIASVLPAWRAARLHPLDALTHL